MVSLLFNEDPQLDHFRAHTPHTRRSIVRTVKNFDDLDIPLVCQNMKPLRLKYNQVCELLNVTRDCLRKIIENDLSFPRPEPYRVCRRPLFLRECPDEKSKIHP